MRLQLIVPENTLIKPEIFNRLMTGATVSFLVLGCFPLLLGLIGYIVPLQIGARGVALPRLNQLSYWLYLAGGVTIYAQLPLQRPGDRHGRPAAALGPGLLALERRRRLDRRRRRWRRSASSASRST